MASGNPESEKILSDEDNVVDSEELGRVKEHLKEVMKKNEDLKEMLLFTTEELAKEKENSRQIVQTLTERLMESRETINKLEMENMRYKKDCMLAVELLQCNRSDTERPALSTTVRKLSDYMEPLQNQTSPSGNPFSAKEHTYTKIDKPTEDETRNTNEATRPRTFSKKKNKVESGGSIEDTTALLCQQDSEEAAMKSAGDSKIRKDENESKEDTKMEYNKDSKKDQIEKSTEKTCPVGLTSMSDDSQQKQSVLHQGNVIMNVKNSTKEYYFKEKEYSSSESQQEGKPLFKNKESEIIDSKVDLKSEDLDNNDSSPDESECLTNEVIQEDKPLIVNETKQSTNLPTPASNECENSKKENEHLIEHKTTACELPNADRQSTSSISPEISTLINEDVSSKETVQEETLHEDGKLLSPSFDEERSTNIHIQAPSDISITGCETILLIDDKSETKQNEMDVTASSNNHEQSSQDDSVTNENEFKDLQVESAVTEAGTEADDETLLTAEENTPLV